jgi:hypothetical protein
MKSDKYDPLVSVTPANQNRHQSVFRAKVQLKTIAVVKRTNTKMRTKWTEVAIHT